jgi:hypothetical protein
MAPSPLVARLLLFHACLSASACTAVATTPAAKTAADNGAGEYEVYNPSACEATVFTFDRTGFNRKVLGSVPGGGRAVFHVLPLPSGTQVGAQAISPDGTDCERAERVRVRRLPTPPPS